MRKLVYDELPGGRRFEVGVGEVGTQPLESLQEGAPAQRPADLAELEDSCQRLWDFAEKIGTYATRYA